MNHSKQLRRISRRESLKVCLVPAGAIAGGWLLGCSDDAQAIGDQHGGASMTPVAGAGGEAAPTAATGGSPASVGAGGTGLQADAGSSAPARAGTGGSAPTTDAGADAGAPASGGTGGMDPQMTGGGPAAGTAGGAGSVAGPDVPWASGGTDAMQGGYPDPFDMGLPSSACMLYPSQTLGPCYAQGPAMREDISDGTPGLPLRLSLLVVQSDGCTPVRNASVDIWHTGFDGAYSAYGRGSICNPGGTSLTADMFCRGVQLTDETGRVHFSTVFPGWYSGRSVHIHFTIRIDGRGEVTSQLYFEDDLTTEIQSQGEYAVRGMRATTNANDFTFRSGGASPEEVLLSTAKRPDGALHAWKVLSIG